MKLSRIVLLAFLVLLCVAAYAAPKKPADDKFRLIHADKLFLSKVQDEQILDLDGNVHFFYGTTEFKSDRALIFDVKKIARLSGKVVVSNDSLSLSADTLAYYRIPELLNCGGRVVATYKNKSGDYRWMTGDYANYDRKQDQLTVWSKVVAYDKGENATVHCGYAHWDRKAGYAFMIEEPRLQAGTTDSLFVSADKMEFFDSERKLIATFNVKVDSRDYNAESDFLIYFLKDDKAVFTGQPGFVSEYANATAREFHLYMKERKLQRAELIDSCRVLFSEEKGTDKKNTVNADLISMRFDKDELREFNAEGKVDYYYRQDPTEKKDFFINSATGTYLRAWFNEESKLQNMQMETDIKGRYVFRNK